MKVELRITAQLLNRVHTDLSRQHPFACERVAFISCKPAALRTGTLLVANDLHPVLDEDYERDSSVGAMLNGGAFRRILQFAYNNAVSILHVHRHEHYGRPWFSDVDLRYAKRYVPDFTKVRAGYPHGILLLSKDSAAGLIWKPEGGQVRLTRISVVGPFLQEVFAQ